MKSKPLLLIGILLLVFLSGCRSWREDILAPPDEMEIPKGSLIAVCTVDDDVYTHVYKDDGIYQYFINDVLQGDEELNTIQEQAYLNDESVNNYLIDTFDPGVCIIDYYSDTE